MNRRTIVISAIIIFLLAARVLLYLIFPAPQKPGEKNTFFGELPTLGGKTVPVRSGGGTTAPAGEAREAHQILQVVNKEILAPVLSADEKSLLYVLRENGRVFASDLGGDNEKRLTTLTVIGAFGGLWSPKKDRLILSYYENGAVKNFLNGVATGTPSRFLPPEVTSFDWAPDGLSIAYLSRQGNGTSLVIADAGGRSPRSVYATPIPDFTVRWIGRNTILLISRPSGFAPSVVARFDTGGRQSDLVLSGLNGAVLVASPDGNALLLSQSSTGGDAEKLSLYDIRKSKTTPLNVLTIAEKCVFSGDGKKIYCGVPKGAISAPSPDEWYKGADSFSDRVVEIDAVTGETKTLMENETDVDVISPFVSKDGKYLFFQDKKTSALWRLTLR